MGPMPSGGQTGEEDSEEAEPEEDQENCQVAPMPMAALDQEDGQPWPAKSTEEIFQDQNTSTEEVGVVDEDPLAPVKAALGDIKLSVLKRKYLKRIGDELDCENALQRDYRGLLCHLEFANVRMETVLDKKRNKTVYILQEWIRRRNQTVTLYELVEILYMIRRGDVIAIVIKGAEGTTFNIDKMVFTKAKDVMRSQVGPGLGAKI